MQPQEVLFEVERILDHRHGVNAEGQLEMEYKVRWVGYGAADDTWEPKSALQHLAVWMQYEQERLQALANAPQPQA